MRIEILGVNFDNMTLQEALDTGAMLAKGEGFHYVVTPNPEFLLTAKENGEFRRVLNGASLVLPDGVGVTYAAKILGRPLKGRVTGVDFAAGMIKWMAKNEKRLYLLGAKPGVAEKAGIRLQEANPGLIVCGTHDGYFKEDAPVVESIRESEADVCLVCLGAPKQELWMAKYGPQTGAHLMAGLGGVLDVFAGNVERAPEFYQKAGLEWLYRLCKEPKRIGRMAKLPLVLCDAVGERVRGK